MFQSLNLFKTISCPYNACERPYCQFKHPKGSTPPPASVDNDLEATEPVKSQIQEGKS